MLAELHDGQETRRAFHRGQVRGGRTQQVYLEVRELAHEEAEEPVPVEVRVPTRVRPEKAREDAVEDTPGGHGWIVDNGS